jgi:HEAT repeat protein
VSLASAILVALLLIIIPRQEEGVPALLERLQSTDPAERRAAERGLADAGTPAVPALRRALARDDAGIEDRVDALVKKLGSASWKEREEASRAIARLGGAARPRLRTHEASPNPEVAWRVKSILAELKELETGELAGALYADAALCRLLGAAGDGASADLILKALARAAGGSPEGALDARRSAVEALAALRPSLTPEQADRATGEGLKLLAEQRDRRTTGAVLRALGKLRSPGATPPLAMLLEDASVKDLHLKRGAMAALVALDQPAGVRAVARALRSDEPYLREAAVQTLSPAAGTDFDIDPAAGPAPEAAFAKVRAWWERRYNRKWDEEIR